MMRSAIVILVFLLAVLAPGSPEIQCKKETRKQMKATEGLWQFEKKTSEHCAECPSLDNSYAFKLEKGYITLRVIDISTPMIKRPDPYSRLKSKWEGNVLYILPEVGDWAPFMLHKDDHLINGNEGKVQHFKRIAVKDLDPDEAELLVERAPFEYHR